MTTYAFTKKRGRTNLNGNATLTFEIYKMVRNAPKHYGTTKRISTSYPGDIEAVSEYIAKKEGYTLKRHRIARKDVKVVQMYY